ncbi:MAG: riboflavin synthase [Gammaproteobacteria bacterium]|nr:riboflavin synthase [Gammaproteobacteria bacterium]
MFTGIIRNLAYLTEISHLDLEGGKKITIQSDSGFLQDVVIGASIAVNGACLTVTVIDHLTQQFQCEVSVETLAKTTGFTQLGPVHVEKSLKLQDTVDGHLVLGHIDCSATIHHLIALAESHQLSLQIPQQWASLVAYKGSIAVHGVSLTINACHDYAHYTLIDINLIPHTFENTNCKFWQKGQLVNIEFDPLARYCQRILSLNSLHRELP